RPVRGGMAVRSRLRAVCAYLIADRAGGPSSQVQIDHGDTDKDNLHLADRNAETVRNQLREGGLVALAMAVRTREDFDGADRIDADFRGFPQADAGAEAADRFGGRDAAGLDVAGETDAAQLALLPGLILPRREAGVVD